ncbi:MAG: cell division protein [Myxococcaceae bacterium]|nr:cell division protein [Myxococcaceae bacterium]
MPVIRIETFIAAPREVCFDLARDVDAHLRSTANTGERVVGGTMTGLLELGDTVTWEAVHLGVRQRLTSKMTRVERPHVFEDCMVKGAFASFAHLHEFLEENGGTRMIDVFDYRSPLGVLGKLADRLFLERYMRRLLTVRAASLKQDAERAVIPRCT